MSQEAQPFRFNFGGPSACTDTPARLPQDSHIVSGAVPPCTEITRPDHDQGPANEEVSKLIISAERGVILRKGSIGTSAVPALLGAPETSESDLIPGKYEGGFKLWECALDLCEHLCNAFDIRATQQQWSSKLPHNTRVLELGCGHGLPGILMMLAGCDVHFQDYNAEVLQSLTAFNVRSNLKVYAGAAGLPGKESRFFAGDWDMLPGLLDSRGLLGSYDMILAAETIYSLDSQKQLLQCIKRCLRPGTGKALIAAKSYYFGVGGGTATFRALLAIDGTFTVSTAATIDDGASNKREILLLTQNNAQGS